MLKITETDAVDYELVQKYCTYDELEMSSGSFLGPWDQARPSPKYFLTSEKEPARSRNQKYIKHNCMILKNCLKNDIYFL